MSEAGARHQRPERPVRIGSFVLPERLTRNALALMGNTGVTALLGVVFWVVATRLYKPDVLGEDTGLIALMQLLASLSELSLYQGIPRLLPQVSRRHRTALLGAYLLTGVVGAAFTTGFILVAPRVSPSFGFLRATFLLPAVLVGSVVLWNVFSLQDAALTALRRAVLVPIDNGIFGLLKVALLIVFARQGLMHGVLVSWLVAMAVMVPPFNWLLFTRFLPAPVEACDRTARLLPLNDLPRVARYLTTTYLTQVLTQSSTMLLPVLILGALGRAPSAYGYIAFVIAAVVQGLAMALSTSLVVEAAHDESALEWLARRVLYRYGTLLLPGTLVLVAAAPLLLLPFGSSYVHHGTALLRLLLLGCIPQAILTLYYGVEQVRGRAHRVLMLQLLALVVLLAGVHVLMPRLSLAGIGLAWFVAWSTTATAALPSLYRAAGGRRRRPAAPGDGPP